jgi:hypothetical protein
LNRKKDLDMNLWATMLFQAFTSMLIKSISPVRSRPPWDCSFPRTARRLSNYRIVQPKSKSIDLNPYLTIELESLAMHLFEAAGMCRTHRLNPRRVSGSLTRDSHSRYAPQCSIRFINAPRLETRALEGLLCTQ